MKSAIAHEVGHCATGCTHKVSSPLDLVEKHEFKANRWAIERYLPFEAMNDAMEHGYVETWALADYFDLSEDFIVMAISTILSIKARNSDKKNRPLLLVIRKEQHKPEILGRNLQSTL